MWFLYIYIFLNLSEQFYVTHPVQRYWLIPAVYPTVMHKGSYQGETSVTKAHPQVQMWPTLVFPFYCFTFRHNVVTSVSHETKIVSGVIIRSPLQYIRSSILLMQFKAQVIMWFTLQALLSSTFLQTLPELVSAQQCTDAVSAIGKVWVLFSNKTGPGSNIVSKFICKQEACLAQV